MAAGDSPGATVIGRVLAICGASQRSTAIGYVKRSFLKMDIFSACGVRIATVLMMSVVLLSSCSKAPTMRAGVATEKITPTEFPFWLSGYAARKSPTSEVRQDIFAKALALEDPSGNRTVIVTMDIIGIPRQLRDAIASEVETQHGLKPEALMLNSSHTHSGPAIRENLEILFSFDDAEKQRTARYRKFLQDQIVKTVGDALQSLQPAHLAYGVGSAPFAINRRGLRMEELDPASNPVKPVDHSVPVLRVEGQDGKLLAVLFGYACHNTTLTGEFNAVGGDYAGYAQEELEKAYPGTTALFMMLCGGDQNPHPRSEESLAPQHGKTLAEAVSAVLSKQDALSSVEGEVASVLHFEQLPFEAHTRKQFEKEREDRNIYKKRRAEWVLARMERGEDLSAVSYPMQVLRVGPRFGVVGLGGEVVVDYGLDIKKAFPGLQLIVAGYTNDVMCYIPNKRILAEGGYEADESMIYYGQPGKFTDEVEDRIMNATRKAVEEVGFQK
jgi:neutral ceramidase